MQQVAKWACITLLLLQEPTQAMVVMVHQVADTEHWAILAARVLLSFVMQIVIQRPQQQAVL
jgi:hypothetical protein